MASVKDKIDKLLAIHRSTPDSPEGKNALRRAKLLMDKHGLSQEQFEPKKTKATRPQGVDPLRDGPLREDGPSYEPETFDDAVEDVVDAFKGLFGK